MTSECPRFETLAAYKENALRADERAEVEAHFADCDYCRKTMAFAIRTQMAVPKPEADEFEDDENE